MEASHGLYQATGSYLLSAMPFPRKIARTVLAAVWLSVQLTSVSRAASLDLPEFGDPSGAHLSTGKEKRLGQAFMRSLRATAKLEKDPLLNDYVEALGEKLVQNSTNPGRQFGFFLVRDPTVNAFAGPGGYIGVHTGLVLETETESELAAVLAHEIAHVNQRHIARMIEAADNMSLPAAGVLLAAVLLGAAGAGDAALAAAMGGQAALLQQQINFTRSNEQEADRIGMQILANSEFDPRAMPVFFQRMGRADRTSGAATLPEFLRTHPVSTSRIADSLSRAEEFPYRQREENLRYHLTRAALRAAEFAGPAAAVAHFESTLRDGRYRNRAAERYGLALALTRNKELDRARREIDALAASSPNQLEYQVASARLYTESGNPSAALRVLRQALKTHPGSYPLTEAAAETMLAVGDDAGAYALLRQWLRKRPADPDLHHLQARAAAATGRVGESHVHLAEYHYGIGEIEAAQRQLEIAARDQSLDFYARSQVEARLQAVKSEADALKRESRRGR